jgi:flavoprotein
MPRKITEECIACGTCLPECPETAILEGDPIYKIETAKCNDCGKCQDVCPTEAIVEG